MLRYFTSGESHGEALVAFISGLPAGLIVDSEFVDRELWRRQQGFGRGGRMKIERDSAHILSGVRHGKTIGSPIAVILQNRDWQNWKESLPVETGDSEKHKRVASPRPGHADLAGALKYDFPEARYVLERASARESAARVAIGALAKLFLRELGIESEPRKLIRAVRGIEFVEMQDYQLCCGFGGTFSVKFPEVSVAMGEDKLKAAAAAGAEYLVANDSGCLMHLAGVIHRQGLPIQTMHLAELLAKKE